MSAIISLEPPAREQAGYEMGCAGGRRLMLVFEREHSFCWTRTQVGRDTEDTERRAGPRKVSLLFSYAVGVPTVKLRNHDMAHLEASGAFLSWL